MQKLKPFFQIIEHEYNRAVNKELSIKNGEEVLIEHKIDPKILFLIDTSNRTTGALARLAQGPWGGNPFFAKYTLAVDLSANNK